MRSLHDGGLPSCSTEGGSISQPASLILIKEAAVDIQHEVSSLVSSLSIYNMLYVPTECSRINFWPHIPYVEIPGRAIDDLFFTWLFSPASEWLKWCAGMIVFPRMILGSALLSGAGKGSQSYELCQQRVYQDRELPWNLGTAYYGWKDVG